MVSVRADINKGFQTNYEGGNSGASFGIVLDYHVNEIAGH